MIDRFLSRKLSGVFVRRPLFTSWARPRRVLVTFIIRHKNALPHQGVRMIADTIRLAPNPIAPCLTKKTVCVMLK
ncbi:hypothetical protein SMC7_06840 [Candidatus Cryosericum terrychapinii]|uniref:Uncharacterized protein n=1 Tax=Candidatus Cryosericum terrychapinii TaxID=2290919 RepID=A0A398CTT7_9BACT|nr:hypothetical protein SMC7_06840 [Candidatus Cryosericum terrychapinii]